MMSDRPNLDLARQFTRDLGPASIAAGILITLHAAVLHAMYSSFAELYVLPYGLLLIVFGGAAFARTESKTGQGLRWVVVLIFAAGGGLSLLQWGELIWGTRVGAVQGNLSAVGFYLMAGPALLVPAGLAAVRPGWVPLIVVPAIVSLAGASVLGHGIYLFLQAAMPEQGHASPLPDLMMLTGVVLSSASLILYSASKGLRLAKRPGSV